MAHWSENAVLLRQERIQVVHLDAFDGLAGDAPQVVLFWMPPERGGAGAVTPAPALQQLTEFCGGLNRESVVCLFTTPGDAAQVLPAFERVAQFQTWITVKTTPGACRTEAGHLPRESAALVVHSRYPGPLRHVKTLVRYTHCPACGERTKDQGGRKHLYPEYGTTLSDVWTDQSCDPARDVQVVADRLGDFFGQAPYRELLVLDLRRCADLQPVPVPSLPAPPRPRIYGCPNLVAGLRQGDCLDVLREMPENVADLVFCDPIYNVKKDYDGVDDAQDLVVYHRWCDAWLTECCRVLKPGATLVVLNIPHAAARHYQHLSRFMTPQAWITWSALSLPARMLMPANYTILAFSKGPPRPLPGLTSPQASEEEFLRPLAEGFCLRPRCRAKRRAAGIDDRGSLGDVWLDIHRVRHNSRRADHPTQLPPALMRRLIALYTHPGELVLDPFNGVGTTTLVAEMMGRAFIGIELSEVYHQIALSKHRRLREGGDPFVTEGVPDAKNNDVRRIAKKKHAVPKKTLQMDVLRIARELGRRPTREDVAARSYYPLADFEDPDRFLGWGEVCAAVRAAGISEGKTEGALPSGAQDDAA
jgi:site-specific DNA-methyltransferase (adenine-specific)